jgi:HD-like signal output (HDOD) protein
VARAVEILGLERIKALAMTIALRDLLPTVGAGEFHAQCWRYNLATATICERLASFLALAPEACYNAGLVHDLGRLALLRSFPREYERALASIEDHQFDLLRSEKSVFEIDHCEAGQWLMQHWEFPPELQEVASLHHCEPTPETPALVTVVYVAWQMADMLGLSPMATRSAATIEEITSTLPAQARERIYTGLERLPGLVRAKLKAA